MDVGESWAAGDADILHELMTEVVLIVLGVLVAIFVLPLVLIVSFGVLWFVVFGPIVAVLLGVEAICKRLKAAKPARSD